MIAGGVAIAGVVAAIYAAGTLVGRETIRVPPAPVGPVQRDGDDAMRASEIGAAKLSADIADALARHSDSGTPAELLATDVSSIMGAWLADDTAAYLSYLEERGYQRPESPLWADEKLAQPAWQRATAGLQAARFRPGDALVRPAYLDGSRVEGEELGPATSGWRFDKLPGVRKAVVSDEQLAELGLDIYEVIVPGDIPALINGAEFSGHLGMSYAWDEARSQWALVKLTIYGVPNGEAVSVPPF